MIYSLLFIARLDVDIVETLAYVKLGKVLSTLEFDNELSKNRYLFLIVIALRLL